jgi:ribosomal protein L7/L12
LDVAQLPTLPKVDGIIEAADLAKATKIDLVRVGAMDRAEDPTTVSVLASLEGVYFAIQCTDREPGKISSRVMRENGPVFEDDSIQIFLAPTMEVNATNYIHLAVNSSGTKYSNSMLRDRPVEGWEAMARTTGDGWEAEVFVPMHAFGGDLRVSRFWRANLARVRSARAGRMERTAWIDPGVSFHNYRRFGFLRILEPKESSAPAVSSRTGGTAQLDSYVDRPIPPLPVSLPAMVSAPSAGAPAAPVVTKSVVITALPAPARIVVTREIMVATGKDLETVRSLLARLPATVATDMSEAAAERLQQTLAQLGVEVVLR